ncbi:flavin reductase (DIM6/NTAB) family NADH-FMN oxidoreductase RutF [Actinocorallia herbida]|uniref:Flavin reductase (DIM6/NTAB) family NADH-FMN oxidoreductase RutF n=1 Tax=Actinocorallia herbida TaxID=58109 RepID=A0A3N1CY81_9ACTN|nr:flavin reductase family protein [Actinocorallia herbida]ROO86249.1 flavin reductase (DIM6/NTAB) family NADH-FMN oxidoreductase RutF [Actinocorallia herbida]
MIPIVPGADAPLLRTAFSCFPSGVTALCAIVDGEPVGMAASSFTSVSLDPPLVSVCVANESRTWELLQDAPCLGVSVLGADQGPACRALAARGADRFAGLDLYATPSGAVLLRGAPAWLECAVEACLPAGDHRIVLMRVRAVDAEPHRDPLVFHASGFRQLAAA